MLTVRTRLITMACDDCELGVRSGNACSCEHCAHAYRFGWVANRAFDQLPMSTSKSTANLLWWVYDNGKGTGNLAYL